jgi:hypothetical protein
MESTRLGLSQAYGQTNERRVDLKICDYIPQQFASSLKRYMTKAAASVDDHVECIKQDCLCLRAMVLELVEGDASGSIQSDDLAIEERIGR